MSDDLLNKIYDKVEKIDEKVGALEVTAVRHDENLREHMDQSKMLKGLYDSLDEKVQPLQKKMNRIEGGYQLLVILGIIASIAIVFVEWFKH